MKKNFNSFFYSRITMNVREYISKGNKRERTEKKNLHDFFSENHSNLN